MTSAPTLTPGQFAAKWRGVTTREKAAAQEHFIDLCRMLGQPTPHEADPIGASYAFEKRVSKAAGGDGFADVWKRDFFAREDEGGWPAGGSAPPSGVLAGLRSHTRMKSLTVLQTGRRVGLAEGGLTFVWGNSDVGWEASAVSRS